MGGGTFDVTILQIGEGVFEVKATNGDTHLGGDDFDQRVIDWICQEFMREQGIDLKQDRMALQRLREAAERAKVELSALMQTEINLPFITADASGPKHLVLTLSRSKLEQLVEELIQRAVGPCKQAMEDAGLTANEVNEVILVGGHEPHAGGPAVRARPVWQGGTPRSEPPTRSWPWALLSRPASSRVMSRTSCCWDVTPLTLGIETLGSVSTALITPQHDHTHVQKRDLHHRRRRPDQCGGPRGPGGADYGPPRTSPSGALSWTASCRRPGEFPRSR